jgi:hypothetical protein
VGEGIRTPRSQPWQACALLPGPARRSSEASRIASGLPPANTACEAISFTVRSMSASDESVLRNAPLWLIRSSSRKNPARQRTSAPPSVLDTETSFRPRVICSTCSSPGMSCRRGSAGRRSCYGPKDFTALAPQKAATKPPSSEPFARRCAPPGALLGVAISNGHGTFPPTPAMKRFADKVKHRSAKSEAAAIRRAEGMSRDPANAGGGRVQACRRSEVGEFSERGRIEEVWRCAE